MWQGTDYKWQGRKYHNFTIVLTGQKTERDMDTLYVGNFVGKEKNSGKFSYIKYV